MIVFFPAFFLPQCVIHIKQSQCNCAFKLYLTVFRFSLSRGLELQ